MAVLPRTAVEDPGDRLGRQGQGASVVVSVGNQREAGGETILRSSASGVENLAAARAGRGEKRNPHVEYVIEPPPCRTPQRTFPHCQDAPVCLQQGGACVRACRAPESPESSPTRSSGGSKANGTPYRIVHARNIRVRRLSLQTMETTRRVAQASVSGGAGSAVHGRAARDGPSSWARYRGHGYAPCCSDAVPV